MKNTRTQRSSQELIQAAQLQLQNRILRAAKKEAMVDPAHADTVEAIDALKVTIREAKKILGGGPQSASVRIAKHQTWITKISAEAMSADETLAISEGELTLLEAQLTSAVQNTLEASD
tara:strand:- start:406 stop:762 length:357 start_codon:yes stop_codon:yes gene_type:complete